MNEIRQVIAMGGGGFMMELDHPLLDKYIIEQARKPRPSVCFLPHATDDAEVDKGDGQIIEAALETHYLG